MSSINAPSWAFAAEAIDGSGDTHLPEAVHIRALPSARLGLPATPLVVTRFALTAEYVERHSVHGGVIWIDSEGVPRTLPFDVTPENPVTGHFPVPNVFYARLHATPATSGLSHPDLVTATDLLDIVRQPGKAARPIQALTELRVAKASIASSRLAGLPQSLTRIRDAIGKATTKTMGSLRFEALAHTAFGPAPFQSRSENPYALAAWTIPLVRVVGHGRVENISWLDAARLKGVREEPWEVWSLPVDPAPRYNPTANAVPRAEERVRRAGATRHPLYVAHTALDPASAPPAIPDDAMKRVDQVRGDIADWLKILLHDLSAPTWELKDKQSLTSGNGEVGVPVEPFLIAGAVDPDVGHWLGLGDADYKPPVGRGGLVFYRVRGLWRFIKDRWRLAEQAAFLAGLRADVEEAVQGFPELKEYGIEPREKGPFVDLSRLAVAMIGSPPDIPPLPSFDATVDRGWLATPPPPNVRRALRLQASNFRPHAVAALAATDSNGDRTLHAYPRHGRIQIGRPLPPGMPLPLVVSRPSDAENAGEARFEDRDAPEAEVLYRLAQGDWFGRWSGWSTREAPAKARTPPMRPAVEIYPQPPDISPPVPTGALAGTILLRIPIPDKADLPPGGAPLDRLLLEETFAGSPPVTVTYDLSPLIGASIEAHPAPQQDVLAIPRSGPMLMPATSRHVSYRARWVDELNHVSAYSEPAARTITDPRPPPPPAVITELRYTARPDAEGHARVDLDFGTVAGTRYRVFASTETTLLGALDGSGQTSAAAAIRNAEPGAPRAMAFRDRKALFDWDHFECLTRQPIVATGSTTRFVHRVSGSLDVLAIYRVLSEGPSGALSPMEEADLVPFAVPNLGPPARPQLALVQAGLDPTTDGVRLRVKVIAGRAAPRAWRLRRASVPVDDPRHMMVVAEGNVTGAEPSDGGISFEIDATYPLLAWRHYRFAVEVQADDPPGAPTIGSILPGEWSEASAMVPLAVIPPEGPEPPATVVLAAQGAGSRVTFTHPEGSRLGGTALGAWRFEAWHVVPGKRPERIETAFARGTGGAWFADLPDAPVAGSYATIRVIDPIGRRSEAAVSPQV